MTAPLTLPQVYARLREIAPEPDPDASDVVRSLSVSLLTAAQLRFARSVSPRVRADEALTPDALAAMCGQFAALHALAALNRTDPAEAVRAARDIALAWEGGEAIGEWLWCHGTDLGVSTEEVARLADAEAVLCGADSHQDGPGRCGESQEVPETLRAALERAERAEAALSGALLRLAGGNRELHATLRADYGLGPELRCPTAEGRTP